MARQFAVSGVGGLQFAFVNSTNSRQEAMGGVFVNESGATAFALPGATGTYTVTGNAAAILAPVTLAGTTGAYTISGNAAVLANSGGFTLAGDLGQYAVVGTNASFIAPMPGATGTYQIIGFSAALRYSGAPASGGRGGGGFGGMGGSFGRLGGSTGSPFSGSAPSPPPTGFAMTDAVARVYQRSAGLTTGPLSLHGTYTGGDPTAVQVQCLKSSDNSVVVDWTSLSGSIIGSGIWSGKLAGVPAGGSYYIKSRPANATSLVVTGSNAFYMGDWFIGYGQSFMDYFFVNGQLPVPSASAGTGFFDGATFTTPPAVNGIRELLNGYLAKTGIPCAAFNAAVGATPIANLVQGDSVGNFNGLLTKLTAIGGDAAYLIWWQGSADANGIPPTTVSAYVNYFKTGLQAPILSATGRTSSQLPFLISGLMKETSGGYTDTGWTQIQTSLEVCGTLPGVYFSHNAQDLALADGLHQTGLSSGKCGARFAQTASWLNGNQSVGASWSATSAAIVDATHSTINVTLGLGTDFTPTSGITGWEVSGDDGVTWNACTAVRASASSVTLTHASLGNTRLYRYLWGVNPDITGIMVDNSSLSLPISTTGTNYLLAVTAGATPVVASTASYAGSSAAAHNVPLPARIASGNLLLVECASYDQNISFPSDWTVLQNTTTAGGLRTATVYKVSDGSDATNVVATLAATARLSAQAMRIIGQKTSGGIEIASPVSGNSAAPDPSSISPSWGSANNLFIVGALARSGGSTTLISAYPTGYTDNQAEATNNNGLGASASIASKSAATSSDNPAAFTLAGAREVVVNTLAVRPA